jgi:hypothetical protein
LSKELSNEYITGSSAGFEHLDRTKKDKYLTPDREFHEIIYSGIGLSGSGISYAQSIGDRYYK